MKNYWRICFFLGVAVIAVSMFIFPAFPAEMADKSINKTPVYAFEFATSQQDLVAVFGSKDDPERSARVSAMDTGNYLDFAYMLFYSLFIASFFFAVRQTREGGLWLVLAASAIVAGASDFAENMILLEITKDLEAARGLEYLGIPVHLKFTLLYVCALGVGYYLLTDESKVQKLVGAVLSLVSVAALIQLYVSGGEEGTIALVLAWIAQLVVSAMRLKKPKSTMT